MKRPSILIACNRRNYQKPTMNVESLQHHTTLLAGSPEDVIGPGGKNTPAAARRFRGYYDWEDWDESCPSR